VASYAPLVFRAADEGDGVARNILRRNMKEIAALLTAGRKKLGAGKVKAVFVGGLTNRWDILLPEILDQLAEKECYELSVYQGRAVNGALVLAGLKEGLKDDQDRNA
jgi:N-acetylglucosamine kinase-like BadF-type ATPase